MGRSIKSAIAIYDEIIVARPDMAEPWNGRANANNRLGKCEAAIRDSREAIKREPRHFGALHGLGECLLRLGRNEEALDAFRRVVEINPSHVPARARVEKLERWFRNREI